MTQRHRDGRQRAASQALAKYGDPLTRASAARLWRVWDSATALDARELEGFTRAARDTSDEEAAGL